MICNHRDQIFMNSFLKKVTNDTVIKVLFNTIFSTKITVKITFISWNTAKTLSEKMQPFPSPNTAKENYFQTIVPPGFSYTYNYCDMALICIMVRAFWLQIIHCYHDMIYWMNIIHHYHDMIYWMEIIHHYHDMIYWMKIIHHNHDMKYWMKIIHHNHNMKYWMKIIQHHHDMAY